MSGESEEEEGTETDDEDDSSADDAVPEGKGAPADRQAARAAGALFVYEGADNANLASCHRSCLRLGTRWTRHAWVPGWLLQRTLQLHDPVWQCTPAVTCAAGDHPLQQSFRAATAELLGKYGVPVSRRTEQDLEEQAEAVDEGGSSGQLVCLFVEAKAQQIIRLMNFMCCLALIMQELHEVGHACSSGTAETTGAAGGIVAPVADQEEGVGSDDDSQLDTAPADRAAAEAAAAPGTDIAEASDAEQLDSGAAAAAAAGQLDLEGQSRCRPALADAVISSGDAGPDSEAACAEEEEEEQGRASTAAAAPGLLPEKDSSATEQPPHARGEARGQGQPAAAGTEGDGEVAYTLPAPESYDDFRGLVAGRPPQHLGLVIQRICAFNAAALAAGNRRKLQVRCSTCAMHSKPHMLPLAQHRTAMCSLCHQASHGQHQHGRQFAPTSSPIVTSAGWPG